ncbi:hypothetical protein KHQ81_00070 [Mycoplasmatota bacterium]|nr:hypothetical protein KHQ81_00070 [Mycoplasmatota bacterium]
MKCKLFLVAFVALSLLTACSSKEKTEYEIFNELFSKAVEKINDSDSYTLHENSYYNFEINSKTVRTSLKTTSDVISDPYYYKGLITQNISNVGKVDSHVLVLQDGENYKMYTKVNGYVAENTQTKKEFEKNHVNNELNITLKRIPETVEKIEEKSVNDEKIVTYETKFTLNDIESEDQILFDQLLEFYISDTSTNTDLLDIEITETIVLNHTTEEFVSISYDMTDFLTKAFNDYLNIHNLDWDILNPISGYSFQFSNLNNVSKDTTYINQMTK